MGEYVCGRCQDKIVVSAPQLVSGEEIVVAGPTNAMAGNWPLRVYGAGPWTAWTTTTVSLPSRPDQPTATEPAHEEGKCVTCDEARRCGGMARNPHGVVDPNDEMIPYEDESENGRREEPMEGTKLVHAIEEVEWAKALGAAGPATPAAFTEEEVEEKFPRSVRGWLRAAEKVYPFRACQRRHRRGTKGCGRCATCRT